MGIKPRVIHRDVKSSNILLDRNWAAKISDFGLSKVGPTNQPSTTYVNTNVRGTFGYPDPDYYQTGRLTRRSDVYAFGVVMFELLCGKKAVFETVDEEARGLASWAQDYVKEGRLKHIIDPSIRGTISPKCLKEFAQLANQCLHGNPKQRPTMAEVVVGLQSILATHEKIDNALLPMDMKIFGRKVPTFLIPSSREEFSVGSSKFLDMYLSVIGGEDRILHRYDFKTIVDATENFSQANKVVGDYFYPGVYKGRLQNGQHITVVQYGPHDSVRKCMDEASILVKIEHENLLQLLGYCIEGSTVYLVYDFAPYATLHHLIFDPSCAPLDMNERYKIILGVARALVYLHNHAPVQIIHCDVKSSNILLNESLKPKLFGFHCAMSKVINMTDDLKREILHGTIGYIAPKAFRNHVSTMADVFSFGVLVLVTISGRKACDIINESKERLMDYVWRNWMEGTCSNIIDRRIIIDGNISSIKKLIHIGLLCVQDEATDRPTMEEVVSMMLESSSTPLSIPKRPKMEEIVATMLGSSSGPLCIPKRQSSGIYEQLKIGNFKYLDMYLYTIRGEDRTYITTL